MTTTHRVLTVYTVHVCDLPEPSAWPCPLFISETVDGISSSRELNSFKDSSTDENNFVSLFNIYLFYILEFLCHNPDIDEYIGDY